MNGSTVAAASGSLAPGGLTWQQYFSNLNQQTASPTKALPTDLPIMSDPAYAIFAANTGLTSDLSRIGIQQDIPAIQRQTNENLNANDTAQRGASETAQNDASQRGLSSSGLSVQKQGDIAGQYGLAKQNIINTGQAQIDAATQQNQATQQDLGAKGAGQAVSTIGKTAGV